MGLHRKENLIKYVDVFDCYVISLMTNNGYMKSYFKLYIKPNYIRIASEVIGKRNAIIIS